MHPGTRGDAVAVAPSGGPCPVLGC